MNALDTLLAALIDYAGLYPPANLEMRAAVRNYLDYREVKHAAALGRFIVDVARLTELGAAAGDAIDSIRLSVIVPPDANLAPLLDAADRGFSIEAIELRSHHAADIERVCSALPSAVEMYCETPLPLAPPALASIAEAGARAKLRMGGATQAAFPAADAIVRVLQALTENELAFKATAGLHHPIRSMHRLTYAPDSATGTMHGFLNLFAAAAIVRDGGDAGDARSALEEQDARAFRISGSGIAWRHFEWSTEQIHSIRKSFFISFGSCSFTEPIADLEALGWL